MFRKKSERHTGSSNSEGSFKEDLVRPNILSLFRERGIILDTITGCVDGKKGGHILAIDMLSIGPESVVIVTVSFEMEPYHVTETLANMQRFFTFFPNYKRKK